MLISDKRSTQIKEYLCGIIQRKVRLVLAIAVTVSLFALSVHYLFDGINKRFFLYTLLSLLTGVLLVCPRLMKWYLMLPFILLYLIWVPGKMFDRVELMVHDMTGLIEGARFVNILIILFIFAVLLLVFQRTGFAFAGGAILVLALSVINYYCTQLRGGGLRILDLTAAKTAFSVLKNYRLEMSAELWYSILYFCFFISSGLWCDLPLRGKKYHIGVTAAALCVCIFFYGFWNLTGYLKKHGLQGNFYNTWQTRDGFLLGFLVGIEDLRMDKPKGYSERALIEIAEETKNSYQAVAATDGQPTIILIMNEAWSDPRVLGNLKTTEDFMPFTDSLEDIGTKGNLYVEVIGGLTPNTEFEVLTGDALALLSPAAIPYQMQVNHEMYSLARVLKEQGYQTLAMHPSGPGAWSREDVYGYFGFGDFIDFSKFQTEYQYIGNFISDECNFNEIIWQFEHKEEGKPLFLFDVTIQNHADYYDQTDIEIKIEELGGTPAAEAGYLRDAETYVNLLKITDDAFAKLIAYFDTVDEPVIVCMYGDHQPNLSQNFYEAIFSDSVPAYEEQSALRYITPYVIWSNFDLEISEYGDMSANYLGASLLECAGLELPIYYQFLLQLKKQYPEISFRTIEELTDLELIQEYRMLQYNHLIDKDYMRLLFSAEP